MTLELLILIYLIIHIIVCIFVYIGIRTRALRFSEQLMPIIALVPGAGMIIALVADYNSRRLKNGKRELTLEELHLDGDVRLKKIEEDDSNNSVIPLEEAMSVNDAETRRSLMLDILRQNPNAYIDLLKEARMDEDLEVTHYASTAMMEMQREYELSLQKAERDYSDNPDDYESINKYLLCLKRYIESGLIDENIIFVYRVKYAEVLNKKALLEPENMEVAARQVENYLDMDNITEAGAVADSMIVKWAGREEAWFAKLKVFQHAGDGRGIKAVIAEIKRRNIYLTPTGKSIVQFWSKS